MISAYKNGQYLGCDETHVGRFAWLILTPNEAAEAIAELLASQPDGWQDVEYRYDHV